MCTLSECEPFQLTMTEVMHASLPYGGGGSHGSSDDVFKSDGGGGRLSRSDAEDSQVNAKFRHLVRAYIVNQLRKNGFEKLADQNSNLLDFDDGSQETLHHLAGNLAEERKRQFEDILVRLELTDENLSETYRVIVKELFLDGINWGRILAFLVFSGSLAVHCARENLEGRVSEVITWTEDDVEKTVSKWVVQQGGWRAFVEHFDDGTLTIEPPAYILAGVLTAIVVGGMYLLKKLF